MPTLITQLTLQDILDGEKPSKVSFQTCQSRRMYPLKPAFDRIGNESNPIRAPPHLGPGSHNVCEASDFAELLLKRPGKSESNVGVGISGRTGPARLPIAPKEQVYNPSPADYQRDINHSVDSAQNYKPFGSACSRKSVLEGQDKSPPPGAHDAHLHTGKAAVVQRECSFGGQQNLRIPLRSTKEPGMKRTFSAQDLKKFRFKEAYLSLYYNH